MRMIFASTSHASWLTKEGNLLGKKHAVFPFGHCLRFLPESPADPTYACSAICIACLPCTNISRFCVSLQPNGTAAGSRAGLTAERRTSGLWHSCGLYDWLRARLHGRQWLPSNDSCEKKWFSVKLAAKPHDSLHSTPFSYTLQMDGEAPCRDGRYDAAKRRCSLHVLRLGASQSRRRNIAGDPPIGDVLPNPTPTTDAK